MDIGRPNRKGRRKSDRKGRRRAAAERVSIRASDLLSRAVVPGKRPGRPPPD